jgi:structural maintenance of chromosome 1
MNSEVKRFPRSTELFNKAYNHISERIDQVYKDLTKGKAAPMGGVAYLSLEDNEVRTGRCQWHVDARLCSVFSCFLFFFFPSGAVRGRYQVSRHASYETISRHGTAVWWRKNGGGTSPIICNPQVQNFEFYFRESFFVSDTQPCGSALRSYQPSPFFVLDEVDAALDNTNVAKVANYIRANSSEEFQFIIISLKGSLYERGNSLVGIYRDQDKNSSRTLTLDVSPSFRFDSDTFLLTSTTRRQLTQYDE